ncbi:Uncharacterised protein [Streptococcus pneumoniae]|nr:Uncharacterised protein [Streptococcus pneumoniae]
MGHSKAEEHETICSHTFDDHTTETIPNQVKGRDMTSSETLPFPSKNQNQGKAKQIP